MIPRIIIVGILSGALQLQAQTPLTFSTNFDNAGQNSTWVQYRKGSVNSSTWTFQGQQALSSPSCLAHYYPIGEPTTDWLVSPPLQFPSGGFIDSLSFAFGGFSSQPGANDSIYVYLLKGSSNPSFASQLIPLLSFKGVNYVNDGLWRDTAAIPIPSVSGTSYFAFKYTSNTSWLDVRFDNLRLRAIQGTAAPNASFAVVSSSVCAGDMVKFTDLTTNNPASWSWQFQGGSPATSTLQNPSVIYGSPGNYNVILNVSNGGGSDQFAVNNAVQVFACTGSRELPLENEVTFFPNPSVDQVTVSSQKDASYQLRNLTGQLLMTGYLSAEAENRINLEMYRAGMYIITVSFAGGQRNYKLLKE